MRKQRLVLRRRRFIRGGLGPCIAIRHQTQYPGKVLPRGNGKRRHAISVLVLVAGVPNAGPTERRSSVMIFRRPLRRLLAIEKRVLVAGDARRFSGRHSLIELDKRIAQLNRLPIVVNEFGLHSCEEVIVKRRIQVRLRYGLMQLLTLLRRLSLSIGSVRRGSPWIETSAVELGVAAIGIGDVAVGLERRPQPIEHRFGTNVDANQRIARAVDRLRVQTVGWIGAGKGRVLKEVTGAQSAFNSRESISRRVSLVPDPGKLIALLRRLP